jgi:hypothetical protein
MTQRHELSGELGNQVTGMASFDFVFYHSNISKDNEILGANR